MTMFRRAGTECVARFTAEEAQVLRQCVAELAALVSDDPDPDDPAVERLFPDVYPESPDDAAEFRRLTEADLKQTKLDQAKTVLSDLLEAGGEVSLDETAADVWLRALTDVRLTDERLGRPLGDVLLQPTEIYVRPILELLRSSVDVRGLVHITGDGLKNLLRLAAPVGYEIDDPLPVPDVFGLIQELGNVSDDEMHEVFNMGCGFCCVVAHRDEASALALLRRHYPDAKRIGHATGRDGEIVRA